LGFAKTVAQLQNEQHHLNEHIHEKARFHIVPNEIAHRDNFFHKQNCRESKGDDSHGPAKEIPKGQHYRQFMKQISLTSHVTFAFHITCYIYISYYILHIHFHLYCCSSSPSNDWKCVTKKSTRTSALSSCRDSRESATSPMPVANQAKWQGVENSSTPCHLA
jgi:hypothetical protein